ncbi:MAG: substrate-binding domain-containing protein [Rubrivivax sp.]
MSDTVTAISSMATREVLAELSQALARTGGPVLQIESVGGVDAARRVQGGEAFDLVFLAADALERLEAAGAVVAGSRVDLLRSPVAVAVAAGAAKPDISSAAALCEAVRSARCIGYSTGPSGTFLMQLFEHWGLKAALEGRTVQASPGVPVASLVASGQADLGFQQLSELLHAPGIEVLGLLPEEAACITTFAVARGTRAAAPDEAIRRVLDYLSSETAAAIKKRHGMEPA